MDHTTFSKDLLASFVVYRFIGISTIPDSLAHRQWGCGHQEHMGKSIGPPLKLTMSPSFLKPFGSGNTRNVPGANPTSYLIN